MKRATYAQPEEFFIILSHLVHISLSGWLKYTIITNSIQVIYLITLFKLRGYLYDCEE